MPFPKRGDGGSDSAYERLTKGDFGSHFHKKMLPESISPTNNPTDENAQEIRLAARIRSSLLVKVAFHFMWRTLVT